MSLLSKPKRFLKMLRRRIELRRELRGADLVVVSIKKSGRTWLRAMLTRLFHRVYDTPTNMLLDGANHREINPQAPAVVFAHDSDPIAAASKVAVDLSVYDGVKVLLLVRDPADTVVSLYHHYRNRKTGKRQQLATALSIHEFATQPDRGVHTIIAFLNNWARYARKGRNVTVVRYEDFSADPAANLRKVTDVIGITADPAAIADAVEFASIDNLRQLETSGFFEHKSLRKTDEKNPEGLKVRRGRVAGYRDYFSAEQALELEQIIARDLDPWFGYGGKDRTARFDSERNAS
jgi:hypothetical protein